MYSFRRCPYAIRARMAIAYAGVQVELREIVLKNKPQPMLDASPKGTVPVLILQDSTVIEESRDVIRWALTENDPEHWLAATDVESWLDENDGDFKHWLDRYKYADRFPEHTEEYYREQGAVFLMKLEGRLEKDSFLSGGQPGLMDIGIFPFVRQFAFVNKSWFDAQVQYSKLHRWLDYFLESALFLSVMNKYPAWQEGDEITVFPNES